MSVIEAVLSHTPWWVFVLFFYLLFKGVKALHTGTVPLGKLAIVPALFAAWAIFSLVQIFGLNPAALSIFAVALLVGIGCGFALSKVGTVRADRAKGLVELSGSPIPLILMMSIFVSKYALGFWLASDPDARTSLEFLTVDAGVSGFVIGNFLGRYAGIWRRYRTGLDANLGAPA